jgi:DnaJ-class molecular chaperone
MNYYELFDIDPKSNPEEIKHAYRKKLMEWHPDKNPDRQAEAEEMTKTLNIAYGILSDSEQRKNYNRILRFSKGKSFEKYVNDNAFSNKIENASRALKGILQDVKDLFSLFKDAIRGRFRLHPVNIGIVGGGLLYFVLPMDFLPDFLPLVGFIDDVTVLTMIINSLREELIKYRVWKKDN